MKNGNNNIHKINLIDTKFVYRKVVVNSTLNIIDYSDNDEFLLELNEYFMDDNKTVHSIYHFSEKVININTTVGDNIYKKLTLILKNQNMGIPTKQIAFVKYDDYKPFYSLEIKILDYMNYYKKIDLTLVIKAKYDNSLYNDENKFYKKIQIITKQDDDNFNFHPSYLRNLKQHVTVKPYPLFSLKDILNIKNYRTKCSSLWSEFFYKKTS